MIVCPHYSLKRDFEHQAELTPEQVHLMEQTLDTTVDRWNEKLGFPVFEDSGDENSIHVIAISTSPQSGELGAADITPGKCGGTVAVGYAALGTFNTYAHELGHELGLWHVDDRSSVMHVGFDVDLENADITLEMVALVQEHLEEA